MKTETSTYYRAIETVVRICLDRPGDDLNLADLAFEEHLGFRLERLQRKLASELGFPDRSLQ